MDLYIGRLEFQIQQSNHGSNVIHQYTSHMIQEKTKRRTRTIRKFFASESQAVDAMKQVAREYGRTKSPQQLAAELDVPEDIVKNWAFNLRGAGIDIPRLTRRGVYIRVLEELKKENPELIQKIR